MSGFDTYTEKDLLRLARRINNPQRSYLIVNPLQGKHIPVDPETALEMMTALGKKVKADHGGKALVIGFCETATAVGAAVAAEAGDECVYLQTTREKDDEVESWIFFSEEHSHATEQRLCGDGLDRRIGECDYILLADDEISTGKTIANIVSAIREACPAAGSKSFIAASLINRVDEDSSAWFARQGITFEYLLRLDAGDLEEQVGRYTVRGALPIRAGTTPVDKENVTILDSPVPSPRRGIVMGEYEAACRRAAAEVIEKAGIIPGEKVLILGTEEFMYPALILGEMCKKKTAAASVRTHATTRSPIGICPDRDYPITDGIRLCSMYDADRVTYLYDIAKYDNVIVYSDAPQIIPEAAAQLRAALAERGCTKVRFFFGEQHVRNV